MNRTTILQSKALALWLGLGCLGCCILTAGCAGIRPAKEEEMDKKKPAFNDLWDYSDPAATETKMREALDVLGTDSPHSEASEKERELRLELQTQIARTLGLQHKFEEAFSQLDGVDQSLEPGMNIARTRSLLERGRAHRSSGNPDSSRAPFEKAYEVAKTHELDYYTVDAAHMMAIISKGEDAEEWFRRGVAAAEGSTNESARGWLGPLYNNLGWTYHDAKNYDNALEIFEKSLAWREEQGKEPGIRIARYCIAKTYRSLGRIEEALAAGESIVEDYKDSSDPDGYVQEEIGECLLLLGRSEDAIPHFAQAYKFLHEDKWLQRDESERLERLRTLGAVSE